MGWLDPHARAVVEAATARLIPGPTDEPDEQDPGAREAGVVDYVDRLLSAIDRDPPDVLMAGPGRRHAGTPPVRLTTAERDAWQQRTADLRGRYAAGVALLDAAAGGDFAAATATEQDAILGSEEAASFCGLLFAHAIEGMYGDPAYGGNRDGAGWHSIGFHGDLQPGGVDADRVPTGRPDPIDAALLDRVLAILPLPLVRDPRRGSGPDG